MHHIECNIKGNMLPIYRGFSDIWNNMVNIIHYFGYLGHGYMEFPLIWDILAGTNAFLVSGIVCMPFNRCIEVGNRAFSFKANYDTRCETSNLSKKKRSLHMREKVHTSQTRRSLGKVSSAVRSL